MSVASQHPAADRYGAVGVVILLLGLLFPAVARSAPPVPEFARITIDQVTPRTVTVGSANQVTITGRVQNIGDRTITNLDVRLQRAGAVATASGSRDVLVGDESSFDTVTAFQTVTDRLAPGAAAPFTITVPLRSDASTSGTTLGIDHPGVYPLLVNVNGTPEFGGAAKLDEARTLLTITSLPPRVPEATDGSSTPGPTDAGAAQTGAGQTGANQTGTDRPVTGAPLALTMLYPLADRPRFAPGTVGGPGPARLTDDTLARSLATGGRLDGLLQAYSQAVAGNSAAARAVAASTCLAVDPDLLLTVKAMTAPYRIAAPGTSSTGTGNTESSEPAGTGTAVAIRWLARLRAVATGRCVVALPFAQVDIDAVARARYPALNVVALTAPADIVDSILAVRSLRGVVAPAGGRLTAAAMDAIASVGAGGVTTQSVIVAASAIAPPTANQRSGVAGIRPLGGGLSALTFDPNLTTALAALGDTSPDADTPPGITGTTPLTQTFGLAEESPTSRREAAVGALARAALAPTVTAAAVRAGGAATPDPVAAVNGRSQLVVPPQTWAATEADAARVLQAYGDLVTSRLAIARPLATLVASARAVSAAAPPAAPWRVVRPAGVAPATVSERLIEQVREQLSGVGAFQAALVDTPQANVTVKEFLSPLYNDAVRILRFGTNRGVADQAAETRLAADSAQLAGLRRSVAIVPPGGTYTLASTSAPILLVVRNDLPVGVRTRIAASAPEGISINDAAVEEVPPRGTRQIQLPTEVNISRLVAVDVALQTTTGVTLGVPIRVSVNATAYGRTLAIITAIAATFLVVLAGRRLYKRLRGQPDKADLDRDDVSSAREFAQYGTSHHVGQQQPGERDHR